MVRLLALALFLFPSFAQTPPPQPPANSTAADINDAEKFSPADLRIDGQILYRFPRSFMGLTPSERAERAASRIETVARATGGKNVTVSATNVGDVATLTANGSYLFSVTSADSAALHLSFDEAPKLIVAELQRYFNRYAESHSWRAYLTSAFLALGLWTLFALIVWLLTRAYHRIHNAVDRWFKDRAANIASAQVRNLLWERMSFFAIALTRVFVVLFLLSQLAFLIAYTLSLFPQTANYSVAASDFLSQNSGEILNAIAGYLPRGFIVLIVIIGTHYTLKVVSIIFRAIEDGELSFSGLDPEVASITYQVVRFFIVLLALVIAFPYLPGGQSDAFKGISVFVGLLLSLGGSSAVSNAVSGLILAYMRSFHVGDRVQIGDTFGDILERNLLVTRVRTIKNVEVTIPNSTILGGAIQNFSSYARHRVLILHATITIGYDAPWRRVHELLIEAAKNTPGILGDPAPFVLQTSLDDSYVSYQINAYTADAQNMHNTQAFLNAAIQDSFNTGGVEIMSPSFYALRDGNDSTIPAAERPKPEHPAAFRLREIK